MNEFHSIAHLYFPQTRRAALKKSKPRSITHRVGFYVKRRIVRPLQYEFWAIQARIDDLLGRTTILKTKEDIKNFVDNILVDIEK